MRAARVDATQADIVQALRASGWGVIPAMRMGDGFPDLVCVRRGVIRFVEVKTRTGKLTRDQVEFHEMVRAHGVEVAILRTVEDAVRLR